MSFYSEETESGKSISSSIRVVSMFICVTSWITRRNREIFERDVQIPGCRLRHFQVAKAGAEFGGGNYYVTHIYEGNYRRYEKASSVQIWFLLLQVDLSWKYVSTLPLRITE